MAVIAFFGVGNMGGPMAGNLVKAGHVVRAFDLSEEWLQKAAVRGAIACTSATEALAGAEWVVSMLPSCAAVEGLYSEAFLSALAAPVRLIDCSTVSAETSRAVQARCAARGLAMIDAPVSGGVAGAEAASLSFLCGGEGDAVEQARTLLLAMGKNVFHAGAAGAGSIAKLCNNMLLAIHMAGTAEALALGVANGLDPKVLSEIMLKSSGRNWSLELYNPWPGVMDNVPAARSYQGGFQTRLMQKDLGLALEAALHSHSATPMGALVQSLYALHAQAGNEGLDFSSIQRLFDSARR